jgi:putative hydrolase of the HAD superfamily
MTDATAPGWDDSSGRRYDAVLFDVGGVLVELASIREGYEAFVAALVDRFDADEASPYEAWTDALGDHFAAREGTEYRTAREGYRRATAALFDGDPPPESDWRPLYEDALAEHLRPIPGAVDAVRALDEAGVYLGIVSDIDTAEADLILGTFGIDARFDAVTTSEAVGYTKPDGRMYADALSQWGGDPGSAVMVGDRYRHDVAGAAAAGIDAVAFGPDAAGPAADYEIDDPREVLDVVGVEARGERGVSSGSDHTDETDPEDG